MDAGEGSEPGDGGWWVLAKVVAFLEAGFEDLVAGGEELFGGDGVAVCPAGAAWDDVGGILAAGECVREHAGEGVAAGVFPGLVYVAVLVDVDAAGVEELAEAVGAGVEADLEDLVLREVDEVDAPVLEGAGRVADATAAREGAAGAESAALLDGAAAAGAHAPPDRLAGSAACVAVAETLADSQEPEGAVCEINERRHPDSQPRGR